MPIRQGRFVSAVQTPCSSRSAVQTVLTAERSRSSCARGTLGLAGHVMRADAWVWPAPGKPRLGLTGHDRTPCIAYVELMTNQRRLAMGQALRADARACRHASSRCRHACAATRTWCGGWLMRGVGLAPGRLAGVDVHAVKEVAPRHAFRKEPAAGRRPSRNTRPSRDCGNGSVRRPCGSVHGVGRVARALTGRTRTTSARWCTSSRSL